MRVNFYLNLFLKVGVLQVVKIVIKSKLIAVLKIQTIPTCV